MEEIHRAPIIHPFLAHQAGVVKSVNAETIGRASVFLGGGRAQADDAIDYAVGLSQIKKIGEQVAANEPLLFVHARKDHTLALVLALLDSAIEISPSG